MAQQQQTAAALFFDSSRGDDPRVDSFLSKLKTDFTDNRDLIVTGGVSQIVVGSTWTDSKPAHSHLKNLLRAEVRIEFAEFLSSNLPMSESLTALTLPTYIDAFIHQKRTTNSETQDLYLKANGKSLSEAITLAGDQFIETFAALPEGNGLVVEVPRKSLLETYDIPLVDLETAVDAFIAFNTSHQGSAVQQFSRTPTEQVIAFSAFRAGKGIQDDPQVMRELLEFAQ